MGRLTHTVSGSIATVRSPAVAPIESLKVHFSPIQEGTGDPSPSNIRPITGWTGVNTTKVRNIWDGRYEAGYINDSGIDSDTYFTSKRNIGYIPVLGGSKIIFKYKKTENVQVSNIRFYEYNSNKEFLGNKWAAPDTEYMLRSATSFIRFYMDANYAPTYDGKDLIIYIKEEVETIPVTFPAVGKNLFNKDAEPYQTGKYINDVSSGVPQYSNNAGYNVYRIPIKPATAYTFGPIKSGSSGSGPIWATMNANGITTRYAFNAGGSEGKYHTFTSYSSDAYLVLSVAVTNDYGYKCDDILQVEEGSSATEYEAFNNTIYGGYVDLATGEVVAKYLSIIFNGSENWVLHGLGTASDFAMRYRFDKPVFKTDASYYLTSNYLKCIRPADTWGNFDNWISTNDGQSFITGIKSITTAEAWKEYLSEHNLHLVYLTRTPVTIATLTPQELATFKGYTSIWSNAGDVDVTYQVIESSEMTKERQKIFAGNTPSIHTASGSVANFEMEPGLNRNLKSCKVGFLPVQEGSGDPFPPINQNGSIVVVDNLHNESELSSFKIHFSPIQAGTGDPSPTNVRPITGWTGVTGYKGGKNLYSAGDQTFERFKKVSLGRTFSPGTYTLSLEATSTDTDDSKCDVYLFYGETSSGKSKGFSRDTRDSWTFTIDVVFDSLWMYAAQTWLASEGDTATFSNIQLEIGSTATSYEPYSAPTSYPVSWESQGTVYGGYVDLVSGDAVATMLYKKHRVGDSHVDATYENTKRIDVLLDSDCLSKANGTTSNTVSSYFTYAYNNLDNPHFYLTDPNRIRCFVPIDIDDNTEIEFACTLLNPVAFTTLTPTQIALATGKSSYWSNANSVTVGTAGNVRPIKGWGKLNICSSKQNIFDPNELTTININGSDRNAVAYTSPGTYKLKAYGSSTEAYLSGIVKNYDGTWSSVYYVVGNTYAQNMSITIVNGQTLYVYDMQNSPKKTSISRFVSWQFQVSLGDSFLDSYESYSGSKYFIEFPVKGKNLCPPLIKGKGVYISTGDEFSADNVAVSDYIPVNFADNQNYYLSGLLYSYQSFVAAYNINKQYLGRCGGAQRSTLSITDSIFTVSTTQKTGDIAFLRVEQYNITNMADIDDAKIQLEVGSSATAYEPYDNSIFGGYVNLVTGEVWKTHQFVENSTKVNTMFNGQSIGYWHTTAGELGVTNISGLNNGLKCERLTVTSNTTENDTLEVMSFYENGIIRWKEKWGMSLTDYRKYLADHPLRFVYELATPQLVTTLTPTQIQALKGTNNILSDANGAIEVKYWSH